MPERISETFKVTKFESWETPKRNQNGDWETGIEKAGDKWIMTVKGRWDNSGYSTFQVFFCCDQPTVTVNDIPKTELEDFTVQRNDRANVMIVSFKNPLIAGDVVRISKPE